MGLSTPNHPTHEYTVANYTHPDDRTDAMKKALKESDILVQELINNDEYVFAIPMYNFSIHSTLKAYIDNIVRIGITFKVSEEGHFEGCLKNKKMTVISAKGGKYSHPSPLESFDMLDTYIRTIMSFIGVTNIDFISAENLDFSGLEIQKEEISKALKSIDSIF